VFTKIREFLASGKQVVMPYSTTSDLPASVKEHLPQHAQEIYLKAFNNAWQEYKNAEMRWEDTSQEETAYRVAWAAVKKVYVKDEATGMWKPRRSRVLA
jgi:cation transport regulator